VFDMYNSSRYACEDGSVYPSTLKLDPRRAHTIAGSKVVQFMS